MRSFKQVRTVFAGWPVMAAVVAVLLGASPCWADRFPPDPVEELRLEIKSPQRMFTRDPGLRQRLDNLKTPEEYQQAFNAARARSLTQQIDSLKNLGILRRALSLQEWPKETDTDPGNTVLRDMRSLLAKRFKEMAHQTLQSGDPIRQLAALTTLGEMGTSVRTTEDPRGVARGLDKEVADLVTHGKTPRVRETAARTLGLIYPDPALAAQALSNLLKNGSVSERQAAAIGLNNMTRIAAEVASGGSKSPLPDLPPQGMRTDVVATGRAALPVLSQGLGDADVTVRRNCAEGWDHVAIGVYKLVPQPQASGDLLDSEQDPRAMDQIRRDLTPLLSVLRQELSDPKGFNLLKALNDPDLHVRIMSRRALENMGGTRRRLRRWVDNPPPMPPVPERGASDALPLSAVKTGSVHVVSLQQPAAAQDDPVLEILRKSVPALVQGTRDADPMARLAAVEALETAGRAAASAAPALIKSVRDPNRFVRWAAARTLGELGPLPETRDAVPALAGLLHDEDLDLAMSASRALERFGPDAKGAVTDLIWAMGTTDAELRKAALDALISIGTDAREAIPALARAMSEPDFRVRRAAAEALGKFGTLARGAAPALEAALDDENPDVRRAASDALLSVLGPEQK